MATFVICLQNQVECKQKFLTSYEKYKLQKFMHEFLNRALSERIYYSWSAIFIFPETEPVVSKTLGDVLQCS